MKVIVGLGNPGREFADTRHNAGWWYLEHLARQWHCDNWRKDGDSLTASCLVSGEKVRLVKPQTYMNLSGSALRPFLKREGFVPANDLMIIVDEVAIPAGEYRLRAAGSAGGHNGLKSIEAQLNSVTYPRLRIGIRPVDERRLIGDLADFVLHTMPRDERDLVEAQYDRITKALDLWLAEGTEKAVSALGR